MLCNYILILNMYKKATVNTETSWWKHSAIKGQSFQIHVNSRMKSIEWWNRTVITMVIHSFWLSPPPSPVFLKNLKKTNNALLFSMFIWSERMRQISPDCAQTQHKTAWCWRLSLCKIILTKLLNFDLLQTNDICLWVVFFFLDKYWINRWHKY